MRRPFFFLMCCAVLVYGLCVASYAVPPETRVYDSAALFTPEECASLEEQISKLREQTGMDAVVVAINDAEGKTSMQYADDFYDVNGFGTGQDYSGVLLLIDMDNREAHISTSGKMIDYLTDDRIETILDGVVPRLSDEKYYAAAATFLDYVGYYYDAEVPNGQYRRDESGRITKYRSITPAEIAVSALISIAAGAAGVLIVYYRYQKPAAVYKYPFRQKGLLTLTAQEDILVNRTVTQRRIESPSGPGSGSGGAGMSSTHMSGGGRVHGGGGRKF